MRSTLTGADLHERDDTAESTRRVQRRMARLRSAGRTERLPSSSRFGKTRFLALSLILGALLGAAAVVIPTAMPGVHAQEAQPAGSGVFHSDTLEMTVKAGFDRVEASSWTGSWAPFRITLANQGDPISGTLIIRAESSQGPNPSFRQFAKDIQLPTGSRQTHEIAVFLNTGADVEVTLVSDDRVVARATVPVTRTSLGWEQLDIAVVDTEATTLNNIASTEIARPLNREPFSRRPRVDNVDVPDSGAQYRGGSGGRRGRRGMPWFQQSSPAHPIVVSPEDLPRDFVSYDPLDAVVIGDAPLGQLTEDQVRALRLWVASGGLLVVTGAADMAGLRACGLDSIMPVDARGSMTVPSLTELTMTYNLFESSDPLLIVSASLRPGSRVLLGGSDRPLAAEKYYGSGLVRFIAINPKINPYRGWGAAKDLWNDLLLPAAETKKKNRSWITMGQMGPTRSNRWGVQNFLFDLAGVEPTSTNYFLIFLLLYVVIVGPINYGVLRWMRKTDLGWITIPAIVILFTVISVGAAQVNRGADSVASDLSVVEIHQNIGVARVTDGLLVMPTSKGVHELSFDGDATYASDLVSGPQGSAAGVDNIESRRLGSRFTMQVPMNTWTPGIFQVKSVTENNAPVLTLDTRSGSLKAGGAGDVPRVTIKNVSGSSISDAIYVSADGVSEPFSLEAGEARAIVVSPPETGSISSWYETRLPAGSQEAQAFDDLKDVLDNEVGGEPAFAREFFTAPSMVDAIHKLERPLVVGFVDKSPAGVKFGAVLRRKSKSFYIVHL